MTRFPIAARLLVLLPLLLLALGAQSSLPFDPPEPAEEPPVDQGDASTEGLPTGNYVIVSTGPVVPNTR